MFAALLFLACAPLAGAASILFPPHLAPVPAALALLLGVAGLALLYRRLLSPLRSLARTLELPDSGAALCDGAYGDLQNIADLLAQREEALRRKLAAARREAENAHQDMEEWSEKYKISLAGQQMARESLRATVRKLRDLAAELAGRIHMREPGADAAQASIEVGRSTAQWLEAIASELDYCESYLEQLSTFLGETDAAPPHAPKPHREVPDLVRWSDSLSTGVPVIDGQHKLLLTYINKLHRGIRHGDDEALLLEVLDALAGYAFTHFNTEEIFFAHSGYPDTAEHIRIHEQFREKVIQFRESVLDGKASVDVAVLDFLKNWLIEHIQGMDVSFAPYVAQDREDMSKS